MIATNGPINRFAIADRLGESTKRLIGMFLFALVGFTISFARISQSIDRIPSDPGDEYLRTAALKPISSLFSYADNQLIVGIRLLSELVILFPFRDQAIVTNILVVIFWVIASVIIFHIIELESKSKLVATIGGILFLAAPATSESQLGNIGGIRWALYGVTAVAVSSPIFRSNHFRVLLGLIVLLGITHPLAAALMPGVIHLLRNASKSDRRRGRIAFSVISSLFILQFIASGSFSGSPTGRLNTAVFWPWTGAGAFWWFNWLFPPLLAIVCLLFRWNFGRRYSSNLTFATLLAFQSLSISIAPYALAGIADRYLIVPFALSGTSAFIILFESRSTLRQFFVPIFISAIILALVPIVKWFPASWYLTGQTTWRVQIDAANSLCIFDPTSDVILHFSPDRSEPYSCQEILSRIP